MDRERELYDVRDRYRERENEVERERYCDDCGEDDRCVEGERHRYRYRFSPLPLPRLLMSNLFSIIRAL